MNADSVNKTIKEKGTVLALALIYGTFFLVIFASLLGYTQNQRHLSVKKAQREEAFNIAEAGMELYRWHIASQLDGRTASQVAAYWAGTPLGVPSYEHEFFDPQGEAIGKYLIEVNVPQPGATIIEVSSTGWHYDNPSVKRHVKARLRKPSWSEYAVLANDAMRFGEGTEVWGAIHSNGGIRFDGVAHNMVTSSKETYIDPDTGLERSGVWTSQGDPTQVFLGGTAYPVATADFSGITSDLVTIKQGANNGGIYLPFAGNSRDGYHLTLKSDGTVNIYRVKTRGSSSHHISNESFLRNDPLPANGLIFVEDDVTIDGILSDHFLTIVAADLEIGGQQRNIYIENDIVYEGYDGTEMLGLIAQGSITIGLYSEDNLRIDGALIAQNGNVGRDYYDFWDCWCNYYKRNTITSYGAIATNQRYGFSWVCSGVYCSGYENRNLIYDPEFIYNTPPFFPTQNSYKLDMWEEIK